MIGTLLSRRVAFLQLVTLVTSGVSLPGIRAGRPLSEASRLSTLARGAVEGFTAGLVMAAWMMVVDGIRGHGFWRPPQVIGTILLGRSGYKSDHDLNVGGIAAGIVLHGGASAIVGTLNRLLMRWGRARQNPIVAGVVLSISSWAVWQRAVMPWLAPVMNEEYSAAELATANGIFGAALGLLTGWSSGSVHR